MGVENLEVNEENREKEEKIREGGLKKNLRRYIKETNWWKRREKRQKTELIPLAVDKKRKNAR